ncbi:hypothetical protein GBAR_LOCUS10325 [Geodia barretti]|uniref:Uncharacterized protein n=1 Tax=Geodia barretti TaxID=519541 RepID=A0AA35RSG2_GEOBA|nr:hypothetical protein GBAR_LOCUS10325 [Geodia barretti]
MAAAGVAARQRRLKVSTLFYSTPIGRQNDRHRGFHLFQSLNLDK